MRVLFYCEWNFTNSITLIACVCNVIIIIEEALSEKRTILLPLSRTQDGRELICCLDVFKIRGVIALLMRLLFRSKAHLASSRCNQDIKGLDWDWLDLRIISRRPRTTRR